MASERLGRRWTAALLLLCAGVLWVQFRQIESTLPYPRHVDEGFVSGPAHRTVTTGTLHPYTFNYPSLPKYLTAAGLAVGFIRAAARQEVREVQNLGNVGYPYYDTPLAMQTARQLFALLSAIALAATGFCAWVAFRRPATTILAPLMLAASPLYFFHSWNYLNVDIVGTCFTTLTLAACLRGSRAPSWQWSAFMPGVCAGLAAASKYTLAVVAFPVLLAIVLYVAPGRRIWACLLALGAMFAAFLAAVPYSVIDIPGFLNGLASEAFHYSAGHRGFQGDAGLPQLLFYARHFASDFGWIALALAVLGLAVFARADWRRTAVLAAFPVVLLGLLAAQRVHFTRNVLPLHPVLALFASAGLVVLHEWLLVGAVARGWVPKRAGKLIPAAVFIVLLVLAVPLSNVYGDLQIRTDSRNLAVGWIEERIAPEWTIVVPAQLGLDRRRLEAAGRQVIVVDLQSARDAGAADSLLHDVRRPALLLVPRWGADPRFPGSESARTLNDVSRRWSLMKSFGTNDVLVNYSYATPWGDPAFGIAVLK